MIAKNKLTIQRVFARIIPYFAWLHPHVITTISLVFSILFFVAIYNHLLLTALILLLGTLTDALDGAVARYTKKTSRFGIVLDATVDRISDAMIVSSFSFAGIIRWEIGFPLLVCSFLISYIRARGELVYTKSMEGIGLIERTERLIGIGITIIVSLIVKQTFLSLSISEWIFVILLLGSVITFFQRVIFLLQQD